MTLVVAKKKKNGHESGARDHDNHAVAERPEPCDAAVVPLLEHAVCVWAVCLCHKCGEPVLASCAAMAWSGSKYVC